MSCSLTSPGFAKGAFSYFDELVQQRRADTDRPGVLALDYSPKFPEHSARLGSTASCRKTSTRRSAD